MTAAPPLPDWVTLAQVISPLKTWATPKKAMFPAFLMHSSPIPLLDQYHPFVLAWVSRSSGLSLTTSFQSPKSAGHSLCSHASL